MGSEVGVVTMVGCLCYLKSDPALGIGPAGLCLGSQKISPILGSPSPKYYSIDMIFCVLNYIYFDTSK